MRRSVQIVPSSTLFFALSVGLFAAAPVATVTSTGAFELHGATVRIEGVPSWPMMVGDDIRTTNAAAIIEFRDGSRVTLGEKSRAKVEKGEDGLVLRLLSGAMRFTIAPDSALKAFNNDKPIAAPAGIPTTATTNGRVMVPNLEPRRPPPPPVSN